MRTSFKHTKRKTAAYRKKLRQKNDINQLSKNDMKKMRFIAKNVRLQVIPAGTGYMAKAKIDTLNFHAYEVSPGDRANFLDLLKLQDGAGVELEFDELSKADTPKVGDKATIDGKPAKGDFTMIDGTVVVCENGKIKKIIDPEGKEVDTFNI